jgi:hypothetical protein
MMGRYGYSLGDLRAARDRRAAAPRDATDHLPAMFGAPAQKARPMPQRDVQAGWGGLVLLALRAQRRRMV